MRHFHLLLYGSIIALNVLFISCESKDLDVQEEYRDNFIDRETPRVYFKTLGGSEILSQSSQGLVKGKQLEMTQQTFKIPVGLNKAATEDIIVKLGISSDEGVVEVFSKTATQDGYILLPQEAYTLSQTELRIPKGETMATDSLVVQFQESAPLKDYRKKYILPIVIQEANAALASDPKRTSYFLTYSSTFYNVGVLEESIDSKTLLDRSSWTITASKGQNIESVLDNNTATCFLQDFIRGGKQDLFINIDLGSKQLINGIAIYRWEPSPYPQYNLSAKEVEVFLGDTDEDMISMGIVEIPSPEPPLVYSTIKLLEPIKAQKIKLNIMRTHLQYTSYYGLAISEINIF